jgi:hypothetical protein
MPHAEDLILSRVSGLVLADQAAAVNPATA